MEKAVIKKIPKRDVGRHALASAIVFGGLMLIISLLNRFFSLFGQFSTILFNVYGGIGYDMTILGVVLGTVYAFATGYIISWLYSTIYNILPTKFKY